MSFLLLFLLLRMWDIGSKFKATVSVASYFKDPCGVILIVLRFAGAGQF